MAHDSSALELEADPEGHLELGDLAVLQATISIFLYVPGIATSIS